ncbi:hypothetical protein [Streptomyces sp. NPDC048442]|uniref:hypothetical protein n=1 Tax=Streptomyces sp. NPDC048442 TaxID=3154823 RepID=UPI0034370140
MAAPLVDPAKGPGEAAQDISRRNGGLHAVNLDGGGRRDVLPVDSITTGKQVASDGRADLPEPIDLHIEGGWWYWTDRSAPPEGNTFNRAPLPTAGQRGRRPEILATGFSEAIRLAFDSEAGLAYVADPGGHVRAGPLPDGPASGTKECESASLPVPPTGNCGPG